VLAFPCNQFGAQEPGTDAEILEFATSKYDANFPMFSKIDVNGSESCELYQWLHEQTGGGDITWNFEKFLVGRDGKVVGRYSSRVSPDSDELKQAIEAALGA
jgi:glutathione peroxidase